MIEIKNLTKIYKSKNKQETKALDNLSFTLPSKGFVFIVGKSGSGKSTLLNMLSGLDNITTGDIIADGNIISKMKRKEIEKYYASYVGFIFQDYHLIEEFSALQNVEIAKDITDTIFDSKELLDQVGLEGMYDRYPRELSGGQKQRVAIARALVKNPNVILADEPTGNLDKSSTAQVLDLLKTISQDRLVVIVSHSLKDAEKYGDRIIELKDGKIISDIQKGNDYHNEFKIVDDTLYLPYHKNLKQNQIDEIIKSKGQIKKIVQIDSGFKENLETDDNFNDVEFTSKKLSNSKFFKLFKLFDMKNIVSKIFNVFIASFLIGSIYVFLAFNSFNASKSQAIDYIKNNEAALRLQKGAEHESSNIVQTALTYPIKQSDIISFRAKYGNYDIYNLYNQTLPISKMTLDQGAFGDINNIFKDFYVKESLGVLVTKENLLIEKYGINNKIEYLILNNDIKDYGIYITDYLADAIINEYIDTEKYESYEDLLGTYIYDNKNMSYINGIIKTNYKNKYKELVAYYKEMKSGSWEISYNIKKEPKYKEFVEEAINYLAIGYSFNPNYNESIKNIECKNYLAIDTLYTKHNNVYVSIPTLRFNIDKSNKYELKDNEITLPFAIYNRIFGTDFTKQNLNEFDSHQFDLYKYCDSNTSQIYLKKTYTIKALTSSSYYCNENTLYDLMDFDVYTYAIYFDNVEKAYEVLNLAQDTMFTIVSPETHGIYLIRRTLEVFSDLVYLLIGMLIIVSIVFLIIVGTKNIRNNIHEIGVLKSLGYRYRTITGIFTIQSLINGLLILIGTIICMVVGTFVANEVILASFKNMFNEDINNLSVVQLYPNVMITVLSFTILIIIISTIINLKTLKKLKPMLILKAKE